MFTEPTTGNMLSQNRITVSTKDETSKDSINPKNIYEFKEHNEIISYLSMAKLFQLDKLYSQIKSKLNEYTSKYENVFQEIFTQTEYEKDYYLLQKVKQY